MHIIIDQFGHLWLFRIHIPLKVNWNWWRGTFPRWPYSGKHYHVYLVKIHRNETRFSREIYNKECWHLFSLRKSLGIPRTALSSRYPHLFSNEKSPSLFYSKRVLKSDKLEGAFKRGNLEIFFILMKNYHLSQEEFIDIE